MDPPDFDDQEQITEDDGEGVVEGWGIDDDGNRNPFETYHPLCIVEEVREEKMRERKKSKKEINTLALKRPINRSV
jgi:hypothetical protein